ncbi:GMC family oxidoreductase [Amycolatopsis sp. NPDC058278]|uniref:GMC family oxidoreductase n=1 Tax=unclassified Amycolatopsis TaxID=2618356 RepID=UPI00255BB3EB|nr:GMC family oxidoreductase N-terminal domain-containing protein [Amycolatopsis sp. DG1A-15b]WIX84499.1 GMC family oxidoreductase N-terminal domain-containing protein [Amycolatopsis sp. DG1A-15b]
MEDRMYDYVIVGAGSAGCVLAARLSEDPDVTVCVIEAGSYDTAENIHIPAAFGELFRTRYDWDYDTHEEPELNRRRIFHPRGKVLGGTSSINAMLYLRANKLDYDGWGQPGWTYDEILPYFKRSEDNERGADEFHGTGGPMSVSDGRSKNIQSRAFIESALQAGFDENTDFNGKTQDGFGFFQVTQRNGRRCSTAVAYLHPALGRPNLTLETHLQVHRVLIEDGRAVGVTGHRGDDMVTIRAEREVILSGGAYNSAHLLMHSGIGPADHLNLLGIDVQVDNPEVGANLQDHPIVPLIYSHDLPVSLLIAEEPQYLKEFEEHGTGPLTSNGPECGGFVRTDSGLPAPDVAFFTGPLMFADSGLGLPTGHAITYGPVLLTQGSRGAVTLDSNDPTTKPKIQHSYFSADGDLDVAVAGVRIGMEIARQQALSPYTKTHYRAPESDSDKDVRAYVRAYTHSIFHGTGTCSIGKVVDPELRVKGVDGLRVADVSVMPTPGRGAPNATAIAIGEKAADLLLGRPALPKSPA